MGRIVRVKEAAKMQACSVCQKELKITKTNTELIAHANSHGKDLEEAFPGASAVAQEMIAKSSKKDAKKGGDSNETKKDKKKKADAGLDDLLDAGLSAGKKKGGKK